jgi:hypothetical protein
MLRRRLVNYRHPPRHQLVLTITIINKTKTIIEKKQNKPSTTLCHTKNTTKLSSRSLLLNHPVVATPTRCHTTTTTLSHTTITKLSPRSLLLNHPVVSTPTRCHTTTTTLSHTTITKLSSRSLLLNHHPPLPGVLSSSIGSPHASTCSHTRSSPASRSSIESDCSSL